MSKTKKIVSLFILIVVWVANPIHAQGLKVNPEASQPPLVRVVLINMSGKSREARVGDTVVSLPVAQRVVLQLQQGQCIKIASMTNRAIARVITVTSTENGRVIPIH